MLPPELHFVSSSTGQTVVAKGFNVTVGRLSKSALQVKHNSVSERHALISWTGQHWQLVDVGSSFGTCHNGQQLTAHGAALRRPSLSASAAGAALRAGSDSACVRRPLARRARCATQGRGRSSVRRGAGYHPGEQLQFIPVYAST